MTKRVSKRIDEGFLRGLFDHVARMENDRIAKRVYVGQCAGNGSVGRPWKRGIDGLDVREAKRMVHDMDEWWGMCGAYLGRGG